MGTCYKAQEVQLGARVLTYIGGSKKEGVYACM